MNKICKNCYHFEGSELTELGFCCKYSARMHELTCMNKDCYLERKIGEEKVDNLVEDLLKFTNTKVNEYVIWFSNNDNIKISINQNICRPNNLDDYALISEYIQNNYGKVVYEIIELKDLKNVII